MTNKNAAQFIVAYREKKSRKKEEWLHEMYFTSILITHINGTEISYEDQFDIGYVRAKAFQKHQEKYFGKTLEYAILTRQSSLTEADQAFEYKGVSQPYEKD